MRAARLFVLLDQLRLSRRPVSARTLAEATGVSERTIYRDMATLQAMGAPIRGEGGIGYQIERGHFLPPLHFDADELDAIAFGMRLVAARGDTELGQAAGRVAAKLEAVVPEADRGSVQQDRMFALSAGRMSKAGQNVQNRLGILRRAVKSRNKLEIGYTGLNGRPSDRRIRPLGLTAFDTVWLLTAWCELRNDFRNFRLDRIDRVEMLPDCFPPERGKELKDYLATL